MGWGPLIGSLERWFADAWCRGLIPVAVDLAWIVSTLRDPSLTVSPGLRVLLDAADDGASGSEPSESLPDALIASVASDLRRTIERHGRIQEPSAGYVAEVLRGAGGASRVRSS
jgi:hypothetical protein